MAKSDFLSREEIQAFTQSGQELGLNVICNSQDGTLVVNVFLNNNPMKAGRFELPMKEVKEKRKNDNWIGDYLEWMLEELNG